MVVVVVQLVARRGSLMPHARQCLVLTLSIAEGVLIIFCVDRKIIPLTSRVPPGFYRIEEEPFWGENIRGWGLRLTQCTRPFGLGREESERDTHTHPY